MIHLLIFLKSITKLNCSMPWNDAHDVITGRHFNLSEVLNTLNDKTCRAVSESVFETFKLSTYIYMLLTTMQT